MVRRVGCRLGLVALLVLVAGGLAGCSLPEDEPDRQHRIDAGPLSALPPGVRFYRETGGTRLVTFGAVTLCSAETAADIRLDAVRYQTEPAPLVVSPWLRVVPAVVHRDSGAAFDWRPLLVASGYPGHLRGGPWLGTFEKEIVDFRVDQTCLGASDLDSRRIELVTALKVGPQGTAVKKMFVDYHVDQTQFTLVIPGQQVVCGSVVESAC
ncbi:MAG: hypothetical protein Q7J48_11615 [Nocardioides sp.]|nr:hypothetical protein [Nocardioides sp.]